jgi:hypothetical protein
MLMRQQRETRTSAGAAGRLAAVTYTASDEKRRPHNAPHIEVKQVKDMVIFEWTYSPPDSFFEAPVRLSDDDYELTIDAGKVGARMPAGAMTQFPPRSGSPLCHPTTATSLSKEILHASTRQRRGDEFIARALAIFDQHLRYGERPFPPSSITRTRSATTSA